MLRFIITFIGLFVFTNLHSQSLSGIVTEKKSKITIPYATIVLKNTKGVFVKGTTSNDEGEYLLENLKNDSYILEVSFIGFKKYETKIRINGRTTQNIVLEENTEALNEVVITAERTTVEQLIDKKVINVGKDLLSGGGNAKTVLSQLSEVQVTQNGSISLKGNQNVNVLVNGKPSPLSTNELLQQIPAGDIHKIEVITSPSAKYQANGLTGIINIITQKKVRKGTSVNSNGSVNSLGAYAANVNYSYGKTKTNYKLGVSYNKDLFKNSNTQIRTGLHPFTQNTNFEFNGGTYRANAGIDWFPNKFNEFSVGVDYTSNGHTLKNNSEYLQNNAKTQQNNLGEHLHNTLNFNTNYRHKFKNESDYIELDVQLSNNNNVLESNFKPNLNTLDNKTDNDVFIANVALDYSGKINDKLQIESGFLWNSQDLNNSRYFLNPDETIAGRERFKNTKSTYALYGLVKYSLEKLKIQIGLRGEIFNRNAHLITNNKRVSSTYKDLFPSLHFSYLINDHHNLVFGYNRRTYRPSLSQVNPIAYQANEFSISRGNPDLKPEFSNNFDISYTYHTNGFSLSPSFTYGVINDVILTKFTLNNDGVNLYTPVNNNTTDAENPATVTGSLSTSIYHPNEYRHDHRHHHHHLGQKATYISRPLC